MTNICTKVTVRKRPIKNGQLSLYLDFYPPVRHPKTGKPTRREYLGIYIYANPTDKSFAIFASFRPIPSKDKNTLQVLSFC